MLVECSCGKRLKVADKSVGKKVRCPSCKVLFIARGEPAEEEDVEEEVVKPARTKKTRPQPEEDSDEDERPRPKKKKRTKKVSFLQKYGLILGIGGGVVAVAAAVLVIVLVTGKEPQNTKTTANAPPAIPGTPPPGPTGNQPKPTADLEITAESATAELQIDWITVSNNYLRRNMVITGTVWDASFASGGGLVMLKGCNDSCHVVLVISPPLSPKAGQIKQGKTVKARGRCSGAGLNELELSDVTILDVSEKC